MNEPPSQNTQTACPLISPITIGLISCLCGYVGFSKIVPPVFHTGVGQTDGEMNVVTLQLGYKQITKPPCLFQFKLYK